MKKIIYVIFSFFIIYFFFTLFYANKGKGNLIHNISSYDDFKQSKHLVNRKEGQNVVNIDFTFNAIPDTIKLDLFYIIFDDGYIYNGNFDEYIHVSNLYIEESTEKYDNYYMCWFVGINYKEQKAYVWGSKNSYYVNANKNFYVYLECNGECKLFNSLFLFKLYKFFNKCEI